LFGEAKKHDEQNLGRSRGRFSTKVQVAWDTSGNAVRFILTGGQRNDITQAEALIEKLFPNICHCRQRLRRGQICSAVEEKKLRSG